MDEFMNRSAHHATLIQPRYITLLWDLIGSACQLRETHAGRDAESASTNVADDADATGATGAVNAADVAPDASDGDTVLYC